MCWSQHFHSKNGYTIFHHNEYCLDLLFLALDGTSTRTDHLTGGKMYRMLVNSLIFIRNESLFFVSVAATCAFQLVANSNDIHYSEKLHKRFWSGSAILNAAPL